MMNRTALLTLLLFLALFTVNAGATVSYDIDVGEETTVYNLTVELFSEEEVPGWRLNRWDIPNDARVSAIRDSLGPISEYNVTSGILSFETNRGDLRHREVVNMVYRVPTKRTSYENQVFRQQFQLAGFPDRYSEYNEEITQVKIEVPEPIIGLAESTSTSHSFNGTVARFKGQSSTNVVVTYGEDTDDYEHFTLVGDANLSRAEEVYPLLYRITGYRPSFRSMAVVILPEDEYLEREQSWSAGTYHRGGVMTINANTVDKETFTGTVIHEAMHGFNQRQLAWTGDAGAVIDEGTAQYAEWLVNERIDAHLQEIFGETTEWTAACEDGGSQQCRYELEPRLTPDHLIDFYSEQRDLMPDWSPATDGRIRLAGNLTNIRTFGYAYAELLVRDRARRSGPDSIRSIYTEMRTINGTVSGPQQYWSTVEQLFGTTRPCFDTDATAVRDCLNAVNAMEAELPSETTVEGGSGQITFTPIRSPELDEPANTTMERIDDRVDSVVSDRQQATIAARLTRMLRGVVSLINDLVQGIGV